ncbi:hypothetical protein LOC67_10015 [Stieleria sp. JC731]|uniref:hypothetical protein n=1 Tax=Pirellulaceae TaxID=2691357 RepID=UPI001E436D83|nr:hypothetical protein [Stieleria sp. JC731]MCC9600902.1 hypothetical protein [Stieleria sp. JC731]
MKHSDQIPPDSIAFSAEISTWQSIRDDVRKRLSRSTTIGFLYVLAAVGVGSYLLSVIKEAADYFYVMTDFDFEPIDAQWMDLLTWGYGILGGLTVLAYLASQLMIWDRMPASLFSITGFIPWIGSTTRMLAIGEFCQLIYESVTSNQPYDEAMQLAAAKAKNPSFRSWMEQTSHRLKAGQSIAHVLGSAPVRDQPICAMNALLQKEANQEETIFLWHQASAESHLLVQSRLGRTNLFFSGTCMLIATFLAGLALFVTSTYMISVILGLRSMYSIFGIF